MKLLSSISQITEQHATQVLNVRRLPSLEEASQAPSEGFRAKGLGLPPAPPSRGRGERLKGFGQKA